MMCVKKENRFHHIDFHQIQLIRWQVDRVSVSVDFGFDSESGQTNDLNIDIHSFSLLDVQN